MDHGRTSSPSTGYSGFNLPVESSSTTRTSAASEDTSNPRVSLSPSRNPLTSHDYSGRSQQRHPQSSSTVIVSPSVQQTNASILHVTQKSDQQQSMTTRINSVPVNIRQQPGIQMRQATVTAQISTATHSLIRPSNKFSCINVPPQLLQVGPSQIISKLDQQMCESYSQIFKKNLELHKLKEVHSSLASKYAKLVTANSVNVQQLKIARNEQEKMFQTAKGTFVQLDDARCQLERCQGQVQQLLAEKQMLQITIEGLKVNNDTPLQHSYVTQIMHAKQKEQEIQEQMKKMTMEMQKMRAENERLTLALKEKKKVEEFSGKQANIVTFDSNRQNNLESNKVTGDSELAEKQEKLSSRELAFKINEVKEPGSEFDDYVLEIQKLTSQRNSQTVQIKEFVANEQVLKNKLKSGERERQNLEQKYNVLAAQTAVEKVELYQKIKTLEERIHELQLEKEIMEMIKPQDSLKRKKVEEPVDIHRDSLVISKYRKDEPHEENREPSNAIWKSSLTPLFLL